MIDCKNNFLAVLLVLYVSLSFGQKTKYYDAKVFISKSDTLQYRMLMPKNFEAAKQYPVLLFLHGAGERGNDNQAQLTHGSNLFTTKKNRRNFPAIIIFPQCPKDSYWANVAIDRSSYPLKIDFPIDSTPTKPMELVMKLLDELVLKSYVNKNKMYVGGMSMGGIGTYEILYRKPKMFAAAFAICGAGNPDTAKAYATTTPIWAFHGAKDNVIDPQASLTMVSSILKEGGKPNFTLYAKDGHNSWDAAFSEPKLLSWLFSNIKQ